MMTKVHFLVLFFLACAAASLSQSITDMSPQNAQSPAGSVDCTDPLQAAGPCDKNLTDFPNMLLEGNDRPIIPHTPSTVSVVGNAYNPGSLIDDSHATGGGYPTMVGKGKPQSDLGHAFALRANEVVVAANNVNGLFTGTKYDHLRLYPGEQIVVPYKLLTGAFTRGLRDWRQIASQLAITAAALGVIVP